MHRSREAALLHPGRENFNRHASLDAQRWRDPGLLV
jgi:hypothetical protein